MTEVVNPEILTLARESRGKSQEQVAASAKLTQGLLSKAENGILSISSPEVERIADYLD
jgi:transcriptional regulator with XRE-family HTH domain